MFVQIIDFFILKENFKLSLLTFNDVILKKKKSRIRETPTLSTDADSRTITNLKRLRNLSKKKKNGVRKIWGESRWTQTNMYSFLSQASKQN